MRILVVSQYFWPENFRINDLCEELVNRGHDVTVLTGKPNYPLGVFFSEYKKSPEMYHEYKGCRIVRVPIIPRGRNKLQLILNYLSYPLMASIYGMKRLKDDEFDVVFTCQLSPVFIALPGLIISNRKKIPVVMWILDLWPESLESMGITKPKFVLNLIGKFVSYTYKKTNLILGQSRAFYDDIAQYCSDKSKIRYFPSWSESVFLQPTNSNVGTLMETDAFKILFAGNVGEAQDFPSILAAVEEIKIKNLNVKIFVVGDGRAFESVKALVEEKKLSDIVILLGRFPLADMPAFYAAADALLVSLKESKAFAMTIPGKVQTYMVAAKPILTMLTGEGSRVVNEASCGLVADSGDFMQLAENIIKMESLSQNELMRLGENARAYAEKEFDRERLITQLENWFEEVVLAPEENRS
ncbi:glycosyltransferase WbuB [Hydrogenovibrio sp. SC-1]|uniref:glycosyltransferase family 4 protein n=1 Tax=Hydrogenovibrio sp. SC-1 TaxID=2065820 RepID=UPI000C7DCB0F|nr:glycosyltransferase family 4 protein [Hydrogenovibrio sp. SC-1]PLA75557.1 glycosyltransferase WbuB [Hydrogenovibrio sp. SC-1]